MHILILAGGGGTRLWPLSRQDFPKQFLHIGDQPSLLQQTVSRFLNGSFTQTISISTNAQYAPLIRQQLAKIDPSGNIHLIVEPQRKNTAPAIAYAINYLEKVFQAQPDELVLVIPSDHLLEPQSVFFRYLEEVENSLLKDRLILFGIRPTKPETGYGYIQVGAQFSQTTHLVNRFVEKPTYTVAQSYCASGDYYWNTGMFAFTIHQFWKELSLHSPVIHQLHDLTPEEAATRFEQLPDISFDYAVLEKSQVCVVCPLPVSWSDVGCWDSVYDTMTKDTNQNVKIGNVVAIETKNSLIIGGKRLISTIGLEDVLIVETDDATFISKKGESQKVKHLVQELIRMGKKEGVEHSTEQFSWGKIALLEQEVEYTLKKVVLEPGQSYTHYPFCTEHWMSLSGTTYLGKLSMPPQTSHPAKKGIPITLHNPGSEPAELLVILTPFQREIGTSPQP